jgi:putative SOS response-associated peptidase YedK
MCGRYTLASTTPADLRNRFPVGESIEITTRYNVAPGDDVVCVTTDKEGAPRGELLRWGLVPFWAGHQDAFKRINACVETVAEFGLPRRAQDSLPSRDRRRLLRVQPTGTGKQPWWITRATQPFAFAGCGRRGAPDDPQLRSMTIITTEARGALRDLHHRAGDPEPDAETAWLDHATPTASRALAGIDQACTRPAPSAPRSTMPARRPGVPRRSGTAHRTLF